MLDGRNKSLVDRLKAKEHALAMQAEQFQVAMSRFNVSSSRFEPADENKGKQHVMHLAMADGILEMLESWCISTQTH
ncbi:hypothetical protein EON63_15075 [archaeon]|nr:MAG: hypothetical protein EON63_15075 [archaeon]